MKTKTEIVPEVVIRRSYGWADLRLGELWDFRELIWIFGWRDVAVRYTQSMLGILWAIIQPTMLMIVFSVVFGKFAKMPSDGLPYPIFSYAGLLPWTLFSSAVIAVGSSAVNASQLIQKTYIPRLIFPLAACIPPLVDFAFGALVLAALMVWNGIVPGIGALMLPLFVLFAVLAAFGFGLWIAVLNVYYRDFRYLLPFAIQVLMFLSPVMYPISVVDGPLRIFFNINPMVLVIGGVRWSVLNAAPPNWQEVSASVVVVGVMLVGGLKFFRRFERRFADVI